ncbi:hypothetical protein [Vibrio sp. HN007]|uniref:hypothetical protein n=1 Tax=Vibrio iocasae TaxID=3098914 RepID=UPI0035D4E7E2
MKDRHGRHIPPRPVPPKTELTLATEAREDAKGYLAKAETCLEKAREVHDHTLSSQRKIAFALSSLIGKPVELNESNFACDVVRAIEESEERINQRQELEVINTIMGLAKDNTDVLHIFLSYRAHLDQLEVCVHPADLDYLTQVRITLLWSEVWLNNKNESKVGKSLDNLLKLEDELIELIAEAREKQQLKVEA